MDGCRRRRLQGSEHQFRRQVSDQRAALAGVHVQPAGLLRRRGRGRHDGPLGAAGFRVRHAAFLLQRADQKISVRVWPLPRRLSGAGRGVFQHRHRRVAGRLAARHRSRTAGAATRAGLSDAVCIYPAAEPVHLRRHLLRHRRPDAAHAARVHQLGGHADRLPGGALAGARPRLQDPGRPDRPLRHHGADTPDGILAECGAQHAPGDPGGRVFAEPRHLVRLRPGGLAARLLALPVPRHDGRGRQQAPQRRRCAAAPVERFAVHAGSA